MRETTAPLRQCESRLLALGLLALLLLAVLPATARSQTALGAPCPLAAGELSSILGKPVQRVNLGDPNGDPSAQCSFSALGRSSARTFVGPQVFLTVAPGAAGDLRDLLGYYRASRARLATRPRVESRPDLGAGAFTLTSSTTPVTTAFFLVGKGSVGTLVVDLTDAASARRDDATTDRILALVRGRLR
jgi:hypothetical protein